MHSQVQVKFHGIYWRMSCGLCDRGVCFDDRAAAVLAAHAHAAVHDRDTADAALVVVEDEGGETEAGVLAGHADWVDFDPESAFHDTPAAFVMAFRPGSPAGFRN
jgi:hypothetical protein